MAESRVRIVVRTASRDNERYALALDVPRGAWPLEDLFEVARETAEASGLLSEVTDMLSVAFRWTH